LAGLLCMCDGGTGEKLGSHSRPSPVFLSTLDFHLPIISHFQLVSGVGVRRPAPFERWGSSQFWHMYC
jgi:hypothetical protein